MASTYWLKLYIEILDDPKMGQMPDNLWRRTIEIFAVAKECNQSGELPTPEDLAWRLRIDHDKLLGELDQLAALGILSWHEDGTLTVTNFAERQGPSPVKKRVQEHRERKRKEAEASNDIVTESYSDGNACNTPEAEAEAEAEKDSCADAQAEKIKKPAKPPTAYNVAMASLEAYFSEMSGIPGPDWTSQAGAKAGNRRWKAPLKQIWELTGKDTERAKRLCKLAYDSMAGLTVSAPQSILNNAISEHGKQSKKPKKIITMDDIVPKSKEQIDRENKEREIARAESGVVLPEPKGISDRTGRPRRALPTHGRAWRKPPLVPDTG